MTFSSIRSAASDSRERSNATESSSAGRARSQPPPPKFASIRIHPRPIAQPHRYNEGMPQYSLKRLFAGVTLIAMSAGILTALVNHQLPDGSGRLAMPQVFALFMVGSTLPVLRTKTELLVAVLIGGGLGALMF